MASNEDNLSQQLDEIEALNSIYPEKIIVRENNSLDIVIEHEEKKSEFAIKLHVKMPEDYPSISPPIYELSAPFLRGKIAKI